MSWEERYWEEFGAHYHTWDALQEMTSKVQSSEQYTNSLEIQEVEE